MEKAKEWSVYLIYYPDEAKKNTAFIEMFQEEGKKQHMHFSFVSIAEYQQRELPDVALNRTRIQEVSRWYEKQNIPVFHDSLLTELGNHKGKALFYLKEHLADKITKEKWAPETILLEANELRKQRQKGNTCFYSWLENKMQRKQTGKDWVIKTAEGHGGRQVSLYSQENAERLFLQYEGSDFLLQERIESDSKDLRVYIVGNKVYQAVLRQGKEDFRSNFSLGGKALLYPLSMQELEWIQDFLDAFSPHILGMAGIDFIVTRQGKLIFNEIEEMAGCRMLYQNSTYHIVKDYVSWLKSFVENNACHSKVK